LLRAALDNNLQNVVDQLLLLGFQRIEVLEGNTEKNAAIQALINSMYDGEVQQKIALIPPDRIEEWLQLHDLNSTLEENLRRLITLIVYHGPDL
jgi:hypothetical protein